MHKAMRRLISCLPNHSMHSTVPLRGPASDVERSATKCQSLCILGLIRRLGGTKLPIIDWSFAVSTMRPQLFSTQTLF